MSNLRILAAVAALSMSGALVRADDEAAPPEPVDDPKCEPIASRHRRAGEKMRRDVYEATRTKDAADWAGLDAAKAKRERRALKRAAIEARSKQADVS